MSDVLTPLLKVVMNSTYSAIPAVLNLPGHRRGVPSRAKGRGRWWWRAMGGRVIHSRYPCPHCSRIQYTLYGHRMHLAQRHPRHPRHQNG